MTVRARPVHTYLGGMQMGVEGSPHVEGLPSMESWVDAIKARAHIRAAGAPIPDDEPLRTSGPMPRADLVYANPPCSRFSCTATQAFTPQHRSDLDLFPDLAQVLAVAEASKARAVWWETGPLMARHGMGLGMATAEALESWAGGPVKLVVALECPTHLGVPQVRHRCHVIAVAGGIEPTWGASEPSPRRAATVGEFLRGVPTENKVAPRGPATIGCPPLEWVQHCDLVGAYRARVPRVVSELDACVGVVLSGRLFAWLERDEWWSAEEYGHMMGIPWATEAALAKATRPSEALTMTSKGVSAHVSRHVLERIVLPMMGAVPEPEGGGRGLAISKEGVTILDERPAGRAWAGGRGEAARRGRGDA